MPSPSLYFLAPDLPHPSGGLRVLYRHAQILRSASHDAFIVHHRPGYRPPFFDTSVPILHAPVDIRPHDVPACCSRILPSISREPCPAALVA